MSVKRLESIPGFSIDRVAAAAGSDPEVLRLENLDTDLRPPEAAIEETRRAVDRDDDNSYLPFTGRFELREAVARHMKRRGGLEYDPITEVLVTCGGTEGLFNALLATTDPGDEVILTDPTYAGMIQRVRLAGASPRLVPFRLEGGAWRLDLDALRSSITGKTRVMFIMNPSMPSGAVLSRDEWQVICELCVTHDLWLIYNAAMEAILFDGLEVIHPLGFPGMRERTITVGSVSKEYRMIGWRVGWVVAPEAILADIARAHIYNVVMPVGITQLAAAVALSIEPDIRASVQTWQDRRDEVMWQLEPYPVRHAAGGWSLLVDAGELGLDAAALSNRVLERGKIAATPMTHWGEVNSKQFLRLVFANEPVTRLSSLRERFARALE